MSKVLTFRLIDGVKCYSPDELSRYTDYPDRGFEVTDKLEVESFWVRSRSRMLRRLVTKYGHPDRPTRLLEIGCGTGTFIAAIASDPEFCITGSEIYLKGLIFAKRRLPQVEFVQFDVSQGRLPEEFDVVAAFDVIEHIEDDVAAIAHVSEMLMPGGHFVVTVPQHQFLWSRLDEIVKHKRRYSRRELVEKLERAGFEIRYVSSFMFTLFPLMAASRLLGRLRTRSAPTEGEFEEHVRFPRVINWIFDKVMRIDEALIAVGLSLPVGGTLVVVARKR